LIELRCFAGPDLPPGATVAVVPRPWQHPSTGQRLAGAILPDRAGGAVIDEFVSGVIHAGEVLHRIDVDGNGIADALTDGLLTARYELGRTGAGLIAGAVGHGCLRCAAEDIEAYLGEAAAQGVLDIDGNGSVDAMTDGRLTLRYLLGLRGSALIGGGAVAGDCSRCNAADIETRLGSLLP
jgi:hypothetical protein